jgi:hypothetical protein
MVQDVFTDAGRACTIEVDGGYDCRVVWDEEITVYGGE